MPAAVHAHVAIKSPPCTCPAATGCPSLTSNQAHAAENVGALRGPLRERVVKHMESIPAVAEIGSTSWYPGKRYTGIIGRAQARMRART